MSSLRCLITAGPTREHIDPIRFLSNGSSGKMGYALAAAALARGWSVELVSGPVALEPPAGATVHRVTSADEMMHACEGRFASCDVFIAVAAVSDFRPAAFSNVKLKKSASSRELRLVPTVDILKTLAMRKAPSQVVVGFAAETHDVEGYARQKLLEKNLDWIVANDVSRSDIGMNADDNAVVVLGRSGERRAIARADKAIVAMEILDTISAMLPPARLGGV